jgi:3-hydroxyisobutyrate dehydrogenase
VCNRSPERAKPLQSAGAAFARSPCELAEKVETVVTILTDAAAIEAVYAGASGLLSGSVAGKLFIDMSTVRPQTEVDLAGRVRAKGAGFVECPVGGTVGPARQGKLIGLMGAEDDDAARAKPILEQLCRRLEHVGPVGNGALMKLAINLPLLVYWQALGEALALSRNVGLDPGRLMDLFADTSGGTNVIKMRGPAVATMLKGGDPGPVGFPVDGGLKDLRTMLAEGKARGLELPLVERTLACFQRASRDGWGGRDAASMPVYWTQRAAT